MKPNYTSLASPQYQYWESRFTPRRNKVVFSSPGIIIWGIEKLWKRSDLHPAFSCSVSGSRLKNSRRKSLAFQHLMAIERAKKAPHISTASDFFNINWPAGKYFKYVKSCIWIVEYPKWIIWGEKISTTKCYFLAVHLSLSSVRWEQTNIRNGAPSSQVLGTEEVFKYSPI